MRIDGTLTRRERIYGPSYLTRFWGGFIEALFWSETDNSDERGGEPMDHNYSPADMDPECLQELMKECAAFVFQNRRVLLSSEALPADYAGHDFCLTRNRHGAGFWDGDWPEQMGEDLTQASKSFGEVGLFAGDDGKVYTHG